MGKEIERKFTVTNDKYRLCSKRLLLRQGYLNSNKERTVRVRLVDDRGFITIKGKNQGAVRQEFEYPIPYEHARLMIDTLCERPLIEKYRYLVEKNGYTWEVDEFLGENQGLVIAEIELPCEGAVFIKPDFVGDEVTEDRRYYNSNLIKNPYKNWSKE